MEYECVILYGDGKERTEKLDVGLEEPIQYVKKIIDNFNDTEKQRKEDDSKYIMDIRKFVRIVGKTGIFHCIFRKMNMFTVLRNDAVYDIIQCTRCKIYRKRVGLDGSSTYIICKPELTCLECNKIFKTQKGYDKHDVKNKHRTPEWIPDGV